MKTQSVTLQEMIRKEKQKNLILKEEFEKIYACIESEETRRKDKAHEDDIEEISMHI